MNLNIDNWKEFRIGDLFDIHPTKALEDVSAYDCVGYGVPLVVNQSYNNGVAGLCDFPASEKGGIITFSDTWEGETFFYQPNDFIGFAHVQGMYPKNKNLSKESLLFVVTILEFEARGRYSYGRKKRRDTIMNVRIKLPVDKNNNPDWKFMEDYIRSLRYKKLTTKTKKQKTKELEIQKWKEFRIGDLFSIELSKGDIKLDDINSGNIPLVSSGETDNGIVGYIDKHGDGIAKIFPANRLTVDMFGNSFYQDTPFYAVSHGRVNILNPKFEMTKAIGLFLSSVINQERFKYSYGRAVYSNVIADMIIKLPIDHKDNPDWHFMENYIKSLPYGDRLNG